MSEEIIEELLANLGIKDSKSSEIDKAYESIIKEIKLYPSKEKLSKDIKIIYQGYSSAIDNEKKNMKLLKETQKKLSLELKRTKKLNHNQKKEEQKNAFNHLTRENKELLQAFQLKDKTAVNNIKDKIKKKTANDNEAAILKLRLLNDQMSNELIEYNTKYNKLKEENASLIEEKDGLLLQKNELDKRINSLNVFFQSEDQFKDDRLQFIKEVVLNPNRNNQDKKMISIEEDLKLQKNNNDELALKFKEKTKEHDQILLVYENLMNSLTQIENEKKLLIDKERRANDLLNKVTEEKEILQRKYDENEKNYKESTKIINKMNNTLYEKDIELDRLYKHRVDISQLITNKYKENKAMNLKQNCNTNVYSETFQPDNDNQTDKENKSPNINPLEAFFKDSNIVKRNRNTNDKEHRLTIRLENSNSMNLSKDIKSRNKVNFLTRNYEKKVNDYENKIKVQLCSPKASIDGIKRERSYLSLGLNRSSENSQDKTLSFVKKKNIEN